MSWQVLSVLKFEKGNQMPEDYVKSFKEAIAVFQHARMYEQVLKPQSLFLSSQIFDKC